MTAPLARLAALEAAATPGPWDASQSGYVRLSGHHPSGPAVLASFIALDADAEFIAASRAAMPALIAVARAAQDLYEQVEMAESVGVCLPTRAESLTLGEALAALEGGAA